jgi:hypothetical protein
MLRFPVTTLPNPTAPPACSVGRQTPLPLNLLSEARTRPVRLSLFVPCRYELFLAHLDNKKMRFAYPLCLQLLPNSSCRSALSPLFSYCSELFCHARKAIFFIFKEIRTLAAKHRGWGTCLACHLEQPKGSAFQVLFQLSTFDFQPLAATRCFPNANSCARRTSKAAVH